MGMYVVKYYDAETGHYNGQKACREFKQAIHASTDIRACGEDDTVIFSIDDEGCESVVPDEVIAANWS